VSGGAAKAPPEKTALAANAEPAAVMLRKSRLDDVVMVRSPIELSRTLVRRGLNVESAFEVGNSSRSRLAFLLALCVVLIVGQMIVGRRRRPRPECFEEDCKLHTRAFLREEGKQYACLRMGSAYRVNVLQNCFERRKAQH
jgi:hypothetical protein